MDHKELQELQTRIKFDAPSMAASLGIDYDQYRRFYYGAATIPAKVERAAMELEQVQKEFAKRWEPGGELDKIMEKVPLFMGEPIKEG